MKTARFVLALLALSLIAPGQSARQRNDLGFGILRQRQRDGSNLDRVDENIEKRISESPRLAQVELQLS